MALNEYSTYNTNIGIISILVISLCVCHYGECYCDTEMKAGLAGPEPAGHHLKNIILCEKSHFRILRCIHHEIVRY